MKNENGPKRFMIGLTVLLAGGAVLLRSIGIYEDFINEYIFRWEMILIGLGLITMLSHEGPGPGIIFLLIGGGFYLNDYIQLGAGISFWQLFFALILILAGILIIFRRKSGVIKCEHRHERKDSNMDFFDEVAVFGGGDRTLVSDNFRGGKILAIFGGTNFNLTRSKLSPGRNYIGVFAVFGGLKLIVPENWNVRINVVSIFGGFTDKHRIRTPESATAEEPELIINGFVLFGGGEIKSF